MGPGKSFALYAGALKHRHSRQTLTGVHSVALKTTSMGEKNTRYQIRAATGSWYASSKTVRASLKSQPTTRLAPKLIARYAAKLASGYRCAT